MNTTYNSLYQRYAGVIYSRCLSFTGNPENAKDLVHDIFLKIFINYNNFKGNSDIYTWIYRITTNECINYIKKNNKRNHLNIDLVENFLGQVEQPKTADSTMFLKEILKGFDKNMQKIGILYFYEELNQEEIAQTLNISRRTVGRKLQKLKIRLKSKFSNSI